MDSMTDVVALATDLVAIVVLAYVLYFRRHRRRDMLLAYIALNVGVLAVTIALSSVEVGIGLGMGLFGILSIIRLRSDQITQQEIAYYFTALALGLLAGLTPEPWWVAPALSALVLLVMAVVDSPPVASRTRRHTMTIDRAILHEPRLVRYLEQSLGGRVMHLEVLDVDLVRDTTLVDVRYRTGDPTAQDDDVVPEPALAARVGSGAPGQAWDATGSPVRA
ncbi:DUF4956 domain-containing protein [Isoptericola sp. NEAU-Y5]|uniref:DUF4956 domain-containing protein n=1 Tax=Isoptericola luteus TaxID=2879484 RepID=A0ABS7ZIV8_9MICO|nr:DUF4956 domain-containing protein [Isoptericola sp. NEAU-Y5]MCA5894963.1 DUF4956 domain-containing protein [Isoptericola sp. NEAU-Y5]